MSAQDKIDIEIFKVVTRSIAESDDLNIMSHHLTQLLVSALEIKGCTLFATNPATKELETLASFGLSINYLNKGPVLYDKSIGASVEGTPVVIEDINHSDRLQYPDDARKEGIGAIVSIPIVFYGNNIGELRLYHHASWDVSEHDLDSLLLLGENIGLAMMYTRLLNTLQHIKEGIHELPNELLPLFRQE